MYRKSFEFENNKSDKVEIIKTYEDSDSEVIVENDNSLELCSVIHSVSDSCEECEDEEQENDNNNDNKSTFLELKMKFEDEKRNKRIIYNHEIKHELIMLRKSSSVQNVKDMWNSFKSEIIIPTNKSNESNKYSNDRKSNSSVVNIKRNLEINMENKVISNEILAQELIELRLSKSVQNIRNQINSIFN